MRGTLPRRRIDQVTIGILPAIYLVVRHISDARRENRVLVIIETHQAPVLACGEVSGSRNSRIRKQRLHVHRAIGIGPHAHA
jgi:hypothetical protein